MQKPLLTILLALTLGKAQAQLGPIIDLVRVSADLITLSATAPRLTEAQRAEQEAARLGGPAVPTELVMRRTPTDRLPQRGADQIVTLEAELERCHAAMQASTTAPIVTPERRAAVQQAAVAVARAAPRWELYLYQQEMAFYAGEDARRQRAATALTAPEAPGSRQH